MNLPGIDDQLGEVVTARLRPFGWRYDVQPVIGRAIDTYPPAQWFRGILFRASTPAVELPPAHPMPIPGGEGAAAIGARRSMGRRRLRA